MTVLARVDQSLNRATLDVWTLISSHCTFHAYRSHTR